MSFGDEKYRQMRECAFAYITRYKVSTGKLKLYLRSKDYPQAAVADLVSELEELHYLDDYKLAMNILATYKGRRSQGAIGLKNVLLRRGIAKNCAEAVLKDFLSGHSEAELLNDFLSLKCEKELQALQEATSYQERQRILNKLMLKAARKGFRQGDILRTVDSLTASDCTYYFED